jgi:hypothetical protein
MKYLNISFITLLTLLFFSNSKAQTNDVTTPLHLLKPDYPTPYGAPEKEDVKAVLDRVYHLRLLMLPPKSLSKI